MNPGPWTCEARALPLSYTCKPLTSCFASPLGVLKSEEVWYCLSYFCFAGAKYQTPTSERFIWLTVCSGFILQSVPWHGGVAAGKQSAESLPSFSPLSFQVPSLVGDAAPSQGGFRVP